MLLSYKVSLTLGVKRPIFPPWCTTQFFFFYRQSQSEEIEKAVEAALNNGYRHIDTAFNYNNEEAIGRSVKRWIEKGGKREELFITSKVRNVLFFSLQILLDQCVNEITKIM